MTDPQDFDPFAVIADPHPIPGQSDGSLTSAVLDVLAESGIPDDKALVAAGRLQPLIHAEAMRLASEGLRAIFSRLEDTPAGLALRRVLCGAERSQAEDARRCGVSKQSFSRLEGRIRARLKWGGDARRIGRDERQS